MADVFLLGAGFSKAIDERMPLLSELGPRVRNYVGLRRQGTKVDLGILDRVPDLESALTYLSVRHPWQSEPEYLRSRALFIDCQLSIAQVLRDTEREVQEPVPDWLASLLHWLVDDETEADVLTLNYDTLLEWAYQEQKHGDFSALYRVPITPVASRMTTIVGGEDAAAFRLVKLHGSLNWHYSGTEQFAGEAVYREDLLRNPQDSDLPSTWRDALVDLVPFIVPPVMDKGSQFANHTLRANWRIAKQALAHADRIFFLGCSLPTTDQGLRFLFLDSLGEHDQTAYIVNLPSDDILPRYKEMLAPAPGSDGECRINRDYVRPDDPIPHFVGDLVACKLE